jgi:hypothetical protein
LAPKRVTVEASSSPSRTKFVSDTGSSIVSTPSRNVHTFDFSAEMKPAVAAGLRGAAVSPAPATVVVTSASDATRAASARGRSIGRASSTHPAACQPLSEEALNRLPALVRLARSVFREQ